MLNKISDRIYYLPPEQQTDRPVLGYINGNKYSLAIDAGNSAMHTNKFYKELEAMGFRLPDYTAITHWHWDHTFGMYAVTGKTICGHLTNKKLLEVSKWKWTDEEMLNRLDSGEEIIFCDSHIRIEYPDRNVIKVTTADIEFSGEIELDLGGLHCKLMEIEAPHSVDSVAILIPEEKVLFIGDADSGDYYNNGGQYDRDKLERFIEILESIDFNIYVLGHDEPQTKDEELNYLKSELNKLR